MATLKELLVAFGKYQVVEPVVDVSATNALRADFVKGDVSPHGRPWHTSFHASQFPGDSPHACGRLAMYGLMDIPQESPMSRWLAQTAAVGKAVELSVVRAIRDDGRLVKSGQPGRSSDPDACDDNGRPMPQMGFVDREHWLTGSVDMPMLPFGYRTPHIVEIKSKHESKIFEMQEGNRGPDEKHRRQLLCSLGLAHENPDAFLHPQTGQQLEPAIDGSVYYLARDSEWPGPIPTHEFYFSYDPGFMEQGRAHLKQWRVFFLEGRLPEETSHKNARSHPFGWRWSEGECRFCPLKKICREDYENKVTTLADSAAIDYAKSIRPQYDYAQKRAAVLNAWDEDDPLAD